MPAKLEKVYLIVEKIRTCILRKSVPDNWEKEYQHTKKKYTWTMRKRIHEQWEESVPVQLEKVHLNNEKSVTVK